MSASHRNPDLLQQLRGSVELAADAYRLIVDHVQDCHRAIAGQPFAVLQRVPVVAQGAQPVRLLHDGISEGVYTSLRLIGGAAFAACSGALRLGSQHWPQPALDDPRLVSGISALSGAFGDHLARRRNPLTPQLGLYEQGRHVPCSAAALRQAFPDAQSQLVLFVHGLCCDERSWHWYRDETDSQTASYGERLAAQGYTPLYLRYNTGLRIAQNGRRLARLLRRLIARWPVPVTRLVLIGHSMGGLVCRAALATEHDGDQAWQSALSDVICLGSPHRGAPLEKAAHLAGALLQQFELSRAWGRLLARRSAGIRDLRRGELGTAHHPLARQPARLHFIGSSLGRDERDWLGAALGDGLVRLDSALSAAGTDADSAGLFGRHHMRLLNDPEVYRLIAQRLS